jgi:lipoprotein signal peptidase
MPKKSYRVVLWALALLGVAADQASKYGVFAWLEHADHNSFWVFRTDADLGFRLQTQYQTDADRQYVHDRNGRLVPHVNQGALFGLFREQQEAANAGFAIISVAAAAAIVYWSLRKGAARDLWVCAALGLILAGTVGNLYDRVVFQGVRDFLHWHYPDWFDWPVFNVADSCLVVGAGLLLLKAFGRQPVAAKAPDKGAPPAAECVGAASTPKG